MSNEESVKVQAKVKSTSRGKKIAVVVAITLVTIILAILLTFVIMRAMGKKNLYETRYVQPDITKGDYITYKGEKYKYNEDMLTFLVMGTDINKTVSQMEKNTDYNKGGQADTLVLVMVNPHTEQIKLMSINRNSMTDVDVYDKDNNYMGTSKLQICLQHGYGSGLGDSCERQVKAVSAMLYDIPINGYIALDLPAISRLNNIVGGVEVEVLENIPTGSAKIRYGQGKTVTLSDSDAYQYVKWRDTSVFDSNGQRLERQRQYLKALLGDMVARTKSDLTFPLKVLDSVSNYMVTDIEATKVSYIASTFIGYDFDLENMLSVPGETIQNEETGFEEYHVNEEALQEIIMQNFYEKVEK